MSRKSKKAAAEAAGEMSGQERDDAATAPDASGADGAREADDPRPGTAGEPPREAVQDGAPDPDAPADGDGCGAPGEQGRLQALFDEQQDRLLRTAAELDNLRKRSRREVHDARRFAKADVLRPFLEVLDNFERALEHASNGAADPPDAGQKADPFRQGVDLIAQNFRQVLLDCGVRRIEALGRPFDPALHEAVGQAPAPDENTESGTVLAELQAGYTIEDLVLRASRVIVAQ